MNVALRRRFLSNRFDDGDRHRTVRSKLWPRVSPHEARDNADRRSRRCSSGDKEQAGDHHSPVHDERRRSFDVHPRRRVCGLGLAVAALVTGCAGGVQGSRPLTTPAVSAVSTSATETTPPDQRVVVGLRWRAAQAAFVAAVTAPGGPDPNFPALGQTMGGHELDFVRGYLATAHAEGYLGRGTATFGDPNVQIDSPTQATVVSCEIDQTYLVDAHGTPAPGKAGNRGPTRTGIRATMALDGLGVWRLVNTLRTEGSCPTS